MLFGAKINNTNTINLRISKVKWTWLDVLILRKLRFKRGKNIGNMSFIQHSVCINWKFFFGYAYHASIFWAK